MRFIDREEVARRLTYPVCIPIVRDAMIAFSSGQTRQLLRSIIPLSEGRLFGVMPGAMGGNGPFGAKLISVYQDNFEKGVPSHQGLVILFDPESGAPVCVVDAGEITQRHVGNSFAWSDWYPEVGSRRVFRGAVTDWQEVT